MSINIDSIEKIAKNRAKSEISSFDDVVTFLSIWFTEKFKLPPNHPLFLERTVEEWLLDYYTDKELNSSQDKIERDENFEEWLKDEMGDEYHKDYDYLEQEDLSFNEDF